MTHKEVWEIMPDGTERKVEDYFGSVTPEHYAEYMNKVHDVDYYYVKEVE